MMTRTVLMVEPDELSRLVNDIKEIKEMLRARTPDSAEKSISHKEAADFLNISRNTLTERIKRGIYPASIAHVNGSRREYYRSELRAILNPTK